MQDSWQRCTYYSRAVRIEGRRNNTTYYTANIYTGWGNLAALRLRPGHYDRTATFHGRLELSVRSVECFATYRKRSCLKGILIPAVMSDLFDPIDYGFGFV